MFKRGLNVWFVHDEQENSSLPVEIARLGLLVMLQWLATRALIDVAVANLPRSWSAPGWPYGYLGHACQLVVSLVIIAVLRPLIGNVFNLRMPRQHLYTWIALASGLVVGPVMLAVDYGSDLLAHHSPAGPYSLDPTNIVAWLAMQGLFVGVTEETPFRALFLGYFLTRVRARIQIFGLDLSLAGILTALIFSLAHAPSFWTDPLPAAVGQQIYVILLGIFYSWLFERSRSLVAPILAHNAGDFFEWAACFLLRALWG